MDQPSFHYFMDHCQISPQFTQTGCTILHNTLEDQLVLMKEIDLNQDDNVDDMIDILVKQKQLYHQHLLSLIDFYPAINEGKMVKFYQYCSHTLLQEIESRTETGNPFTEEQLENILVSGLKLLQYLEQCQIGHGCVSPLDICLSDDLVKIVDPSIASSNPLSIAQGYYYSPQMMECIMKGNDQDIDIFKNDVFSLAVCVIHCGLLTSCHDCYDYDRGEFIFERLEEKVGELNEVYSEKLVKVLIKMLDEDMELRPNSTQVLKLIEEEFEEEQIQIQQSGGVYQNEEVYQQEEHYEEYPQYQQHPHQYQHQNYQEYPEQSHPQYIQQQNEDYIAQQSYFKQQPQQQQYLVEQSFNMEAKPVAPLQVSKVNSSNENSSSIANLSKTKERLASMINRAKLNITKIRENNANLE